MTVTRVIRLGCTQWNRFVTPSPLFHHGRRIARRRLIQLRSASYGNRIRLLTTQTANLSNVSQKSLPIYCPGCGASSQASSKDEAGHYSLTRSAVKAYLGHGSSNLETENKKDAIFFSALQDHRKDVLQQDLEAAHIRQVEPDKSNVSIPICDRCHNLIHHNGGTSIYHPSLKSIEDIISSSPFKYNHIYHVIDAADFPMSLISNLTHRLNIANLRNQNRRSKHRQFSGNRSAEVSFIITRSDLLAAKKEQVDSLMPYIRDVLRSALAHRDRKARLGNVSCVSSKRGWSTKDIKESIWRRGGAGWMVGKVNVGKSNLFEAVFPKGRMQMNVSMQADTASTPVTSVVDSGMERKTVESSPQLPPPQLETDYPVMPVISSLPGTTASPIRVPFGNGKGELIDLPGLKRGELEEYVKPELRQSLIMKSRIQPKRHVIKAYQSLLLGCLIRITPVTSDQIFMMHPFINLHPHCTSTEKATAIHSGHCESGIQSVAGSNAGPEISSAGKLKLEWDVTRRFAGPLTAKSAAALKPEQLPFIIFGVDLLIEGYGWVEIVAQVRRKAWNEARRTSDGEKDSAWPASTDDDIKDDPNVPYPEVEVFSPQGKFIGSRKPMCASLQLKSSLSSRRRKARPRISMKSVKARRPPGTLTGVSSKSL